MIIICITILACLLLSSIFILYCYWSNKQDKECACPLFWQNYYCSNENEILKRDYLERLQSLQDNDTALVVKAIQKHPNTFQNLIKGWTNNDVTIFEGSVLDEEMLGKYLTILEVCSQFHLHGIITGSMFWGDYAYLLQSILACKAVCTYIDHEPALDGLKAELAEMKKRIK